MCCTRLAGNTGRKNRHFGTMAQFCRSISSELRHVSTIGKNLLNSNMSSTCSHNMAKFGQLTAKIGSLVWGTPENFNGFRVLSLLLQRHCSPEANQTLHDVWPSPVLVHFVYTFSGAKFTLRTSLAFSCIGSVTARHSSSGRQRYFALWYKEWNYGTFANGATYVRLSGHHGRTLVCHLPICPCSETLTDSDFGTHELEYIC